MEVNRISADEMYSLVTLRWTPKIRPPVKMDFRGSAGQKADDESKTQAA